MNMKKKLLSIVMTVVLTVSMCACGKSSTDTNTGSAAATEAAKTENTEKIVLGINDWPGSYWWLAVDDLGYFKEQGVDVEVKLFSNYSDGLNALISGSVDMFVPALADIIPGYVNGGNIKVVMVQDFSAGADGVIAKSDIKDAKARRVKRTVLRIWEISVEPLLRSHR